MNTNIITLIGNFNDAYRMNALAAMKFFSQLTPDDQCALISALHLGRNYLSHRSFLENSHVFPGPVNRYWYTGDEQGTDWQVILDSFNDIIYDKQRHLPQYFRSFIQFAHRAKLDLAYF